MSRLTPEQFARELIDRAWEAEDDIERVRLVLTLNPHDNQGAATA